MGDGKPRVAVAFAAVFLLLTLSFYALPDQAGRNLLLYLAALLAHFGLVRPGVARRAFREQDGFVVVLLVLVPAVSLLWSQGASGDDVQDLLVAAYCLLAVYGGVAWVVQLRPALAGTLADVMLVGGSIAGAVALVDWVWRGPEPGAFRLEGLGAIDNPVHASVLLLGGTLPVLVSVLQGRRQAVWLAGAVVPVAFAALAGARAAAVAYLLVVTWVVWRLRPRLLMWLAGLLAAAAALLVALLGAGAEEIWIGRGWSFRDTVWQQVWSAYRECSVLVGCGIATPLSIEVADVVGERAHSIYLAALYHQGIFGLVVLLGAAGWLVRRGMTGGQTMGWACMLCFTLIANLTSGDHLLVRASLFWPAFWIPVMVICASAGTGSWTRAAR